MTEEKAKSSKTKTTPAPASTDQNDAQKEPPTPLRCFTGSAIAATLSLLAYRLTIAIATTYANKPVVSDNQAVISLSAAVRTLVVGIVALGAGVFGIAALGVGALGIQLLFKKDVKQDPQS